ncbi:MAG: hypothetical protein JW863_19500 [Chitinispirillaceae bacterium]|nr:hypothetical protein [Chitinispirillaceae bacterium]
MKKLIVLLFAGMVLIPAVTVNARWVKTNGPGGATIRFLAKGSSAIFASTDHQGIFRSTDNGETWSAMPVSGQQYDNTDAFVSGGSVSFAVQAGSIYRSSDNCATWSNVCASIGENIYVKALEMNADYLFVLSVNNGVFRSADSGVTWTAVNDGIDDINSLESIVVMGNNIFVGGSKHVPSGSNHAVFRSPDNGTTWSPSDSGIADATSIYSLMISGPDIIATTNRVDFYRSSDSGASWNAFNSGFLRSNPSMDTNAFYAADIFMSSEGSMLVAGQISYPPSPVFLSDDNGLNWSAIGSGLPMSRITSCLVNGTTIFAGSNYTGIFRSTDKGESWEPANSGITCTTVSSLVESGESVFASTYGAGVFVSADNGMNWTVFNSGLAALYFLSLAISEEYIYACSPGAGIFRSPLDGADWVCVDSSLPVRNTRSLTVYDGNVFAANDSGLFFSDNGDHWTAVDGVPPGDGEAIRTFLVCDETLFVGGAAGLFVYDRESTALRRAGSWPADNPITVLAGNGSLIFAGTAENGCYVSTDKGRNWDKTTLPHRYTFPSTIPETDLLPVTGLSIRGTIVVASIPGPGFMSSVGGCYLSADSGSSWTSIGPDSSSHTSIAKILLRDSCILAGAYESGIWQASIPEVSKSIHGSFKTELNRTPQVSLQRAGRATVTCTLARTARVAVTVHTLTGRLVASPVDKKLPPGSYRWHWNGGVTSGLYIVRLTTGDRVFSRIITLTR